MKKEKIKLMLPSQEMKNRVMAFRAEFFEHGEQKIYGSCGLHHYEQFEDWLTETRRPAAELSLERLPAVTYLAVRISDNTIVGSVNIRLYLDEERYHNGHIGYAVRPSERCKGYGTEILRLALIKAETLGVIEPVVTCNMGNKGSKRVIEKNGLRFQRKFLEDNGNTVLIFTKPL